MAQPSLAHYSAGEVALYVLYCVRWRVLSVSVWAASCLYVSVDRRVLHNPLQHTGETGGALATLERRNYSQDGTALDYLHTGDTGGTLATLEERRGCARAYDI